MHGAEAEIWDEIAKYYADPLGYVMFAFPWDTDKSIQLVELKEPYASRFNCKWGPDEWACHFLEELGNDIKARNFNGKDAVEPIRYATSSGHGIGKSTLVAWLIKFLMDTRPFCKGIVTANTSDQLRTKTWAELGKWHKISITSSFFNYSSGRGAMSLYHKDYKEQWRTDAQTCREENSEAFQGLHAANSTPFYIFDEASGIPNKIWEARAGGATDGEPMSFDFGNPTRNSGMFFENCVGQFRHRFKVRQIDSREVSITNKDLIKEWQEDHGEDSDFFKVKVRGVFPSAGAIQFISTDDVTSAMLRPLVEDDHGPLLIGVDVARFGDDETVIYPRLGYNARTWPIKRFSGLDTVQVVGKVVETLREFAELGKQCSGLYIDGGGLGGGVVDQLRHLGYTPIEVNFGGKPTDFNTYRFKADEMWGGMKKAMEKLCLPNSADLRAQLTQREYGYTVAGHKINLESKTDMKKRGLQSPDLADALALTFAEDLPVTIGIPSLNQPQFVKSNYNPLEASW